MNVATLGIPLSELTSLQLDPQEYGAHLQVENQSILNRGFSMDDLAALERGDFNDEQAKAMFAQIMRGITSATSSFPVRENLEEQARALVPVETPLRNLLPRVPGKGTSVQTRVITSFGTGLGTATTTNGSTNAANTLVVANTAGFFVGETILVNGSTSYGPITAKTATVLTLASGPSLNSQTSGQTVVKTSDYDPENSTATQGFFAETGAPEEATTVYANRQFSYKLMGQLGSITQFAMAAGANFTNQMALEKANALKRLMRLEEFALLHGDSTATNKPWGDGSTALSFDGLIKLVTGGAVSANIQTSVGALTLAHIDQQLTRIWNNGGFDHYIMISAQEAKSLSKLAQSGSNNIRYMVKQEGGTLGVSVTGYVHPMTQQTVPIYVSRFLPAGTMVFGSKTVADGTPAAAVNVLPQVQLPELVPNTNIQGYVAQEIAPAVATPQKLSFLVSVYETFQMLHYSAFAISTGVTPA